MRADRLVHLRVSRSEVVSRPLAAEARLLGLGHLDHLFLAALLAGAGRRRLLAVEVAQVLEGHGVLPLQAAVLGRLGRLGLAGVCVFSLAWVVLFLFLGRRG